ncbi:transcription elongation factor S-II [Glomus cerebriforme]|uniref:Transcription elongation factor S-II n=1 Tax=Glomus cerebriforme TaxID=658196 RepID=A0A397T9H8_9GLOM|nr:transcription elongation factor S-II [Glomus cerebriforme]
MPVQVATGDKFRDNCITLIHKALTGDDKIKNNEAEESRLAEKARLIEYYIYRNSNFTVNKYYKDTARSKIWNLKDKKNPELRQNVAEGFISEEEFAQMDAEAMASKERKRQNIIIRKNSLASSIADLSDLDRQIDRNS